MLGTTRRTAEWHRGWSEINFGELLRNYRASARLTQEQLASRAGLSLDAVSALERGARRLPRRATLLALAEALRLNPGQRDALVAAAQQPSHWPDAARMPLLLLPPPTPFVGRSAEMTELLALSSRPNVRLVTLTGPPGVGKTRLVQELCRSIADDYDATFAVPLAGLADHDLVGPAICQAIGLRDRRGQRTVDAIARFCLRRRVLMVLDNFEHLMEAASLLAELLPSCPGLRLLVTSRASLRIRGEHEFTIEPLPLPGPDAISAESLAQVPSVALFADRAQAAALNFELTSLNGPVIAAICRRLDGLPLALELAAPWVKLLTPQALLEQLHRRAGLDMEGSRDLPERQRTMAATLAWSCGLLRGDERALLRRLSVFAGSAPLEAIETVCQAPGLLPASMTRLLGVLADQHLIRRLPGIDDQPRVAMLETVRTYSQMLLSEAAEAEATKRAHAEHYHAFVSRTEAELVGPDQGLWFKRIEDELDNVRGTLGWSEQHDVELGLETAARLEVFWDTRGRRREGLAWIERLLYKADDVPRPARAAAQRAAGLLAARLGEFDLSQQRHEESLELSRDLGDQSGVAAVMHGMGLLNLWKGLMPVAERRLREALRIRRDTHDRYGTAVTLNLLGIVASELGHEARAMRLYGESLATYRDLGNRVGISRCLLNLGVSTRRLGDLEQSAATLKEAVAIARELDAPELLGAALVNLANIPRSQGDAAAARLLYAESMSEFTQIGDYRWIAYTLECLAWLCWNEGTRNQAARIYGAAAELRHQFAMPGWPVTSSEHAEALNALRTELGVDVFNQEYELGGGLTPAQATVEAIGHGE